jgi:DNA-binding transcriptional ArsR family regulator
VSRREPIGRGGWWYKNAIARSDLSPPARLIALTLEGEAYTPTGEVEVDVSLSKLAKATGLSRRTVAYKLDELEVGDWLTRRQPDKWAAIKLHETTGYTLTIPRGYPADSSESARVWASAPDALGLVHQMQKLVQETTEASARDAHSDYRNYTGGADSASAPPAPRLTTQDAAHVYVDNGKADGPHGLGNCAECDEPADAVRHRVTPHRYIESPLFDAAGRKQCAVCAGHREAKVGPLEDRRKLHLVDEAHTYVETDADDPHESCAECGNPADDHRHHTDWRDYISRTEEETP